MPAGHIFPLIARDSSVLLRSGHTGPGRSLQARGLPPVGVISELINDDGTVMKGEQVAAAPPTAKHVTIADMIAYRQAREKLIEGVAPVPTARSARPGYAYRSRSTTSRMPPSSTMTSVARQKNVRPAAQPNIVKDLYRRPGGR